jgi:hypothetical protein
MIFFRLLTSLDENELSKGVNLLGNLLSSNEIIFLFQGIILQEGTYAFIIRENLPGFNVIWKTRTI